MNSAATRTLSLKASLAVAAVTATAALAPAAAMADAGPQLSALSLSDHSLHPKQATAVTYSNSESAITTLLVERHGKSGWKAVGQLIHEDHAGVNRVPFAARVGKRGLPTGSYRIRAASRDSAGLVSGIRRTTFRVVGR